MSRSAQLVGADLGDCFDLFTASAFRLETLPSYDVSAEEERLRAFRLGLPRPERSVRTSPWLRRIAETTAAGKRWCRVRVLARPLSEYQRYQMIGYRESAAAGDVVRIADRSVHPELAVLQRDFWLFDADTPQLFAALMQYDRDGRYLGATVTDDVAAVSKCKAEAALALRHSVPLAGYLADKEIEAA